MFYVLLQQAMTSEQRFSDVDATSWRPVPAGELQGKWFRVQGRLKSVCALTQTDQFFWFILMYRLNRTKSLSLA